MPKRIVTALGLTAIGLPAIILGGIFYFAAIAVILVGGAREFVRMYRATGFEPHEWISAGGVLLIAAARFFFPSTAIPILVLSIMAAMTYHVFAFERGRDKAALDFCITAAGIVYLGWLGSYLLDLRALPAGGWWLMLVMPMVWAGDTGAYSIGAAYGKHKMAPRISPKKSWEGYFAGIFTSALIGTIFSYAYSSVGLRPLSGMISPLQGALIGLALGALTPLGDLGESMFKRQSHMKDSGDAFPGHGGIFDRIDSWIWGAPLGYFLIQYFIF